jgi:hypothetical protein
MHVTCPDYFIILIIWRIWIKEFLIVTCSADSLSLHYQCKTGKNYSQSLYNFEVKIILKIKVQLSLCLIKHHATKTYGGMAQPFLTSALDKSGQLHVPAAIYPAKESLVPIGWGWVGPRAGLHALEWNKSLTPVGNPIPSLYRLSYLGSKDVHRSKYSYRLSTANIKSWIIITALFRRVVW